MKKRKKNTGIKHLVKRGKYYYIDIRINGKRVVRSTGETEKDKATEALNGLLAEKEQLLIKDEKNKQLDTINSIKKAKLKNISKQWRKNILKIKDDKSSWLHLDWMAAKRRALKRKISFSLTYKDMVTIVLNTGGRCEITGIPFSFNKIEGARVPPYKPSMDRINNTAGYSIGNCRFVCFCANVAINAWGDQVLEKMAKGFLYKKLFAEFESTL